jgi:hypothetical protein
MKESLQAGNRETIDWAGKLKNVTLYPILHQKLYVSKSLSYEEANHHLSGL